MTKENKEIKKPAVKKADNDDINAEEIAQQFFADMRRKIKKISMPIPPKHR